jgi:hypothetical protein
MEENPLHIYIYEIMDRAKEAIQRTYGEKRINTCLFEISLTPSDSVSSIDPFMLLGHNLNPTFFSGQLFVLSEGDEKPIPLHFENVC